MGTRSVMDWPRESLYLDIIDVVHLNKDWNKRQPTQKKKKQTYEMPLMKPKEVLLFLFRRPTCKPERPSGTISSYQ